MDVYARARAAGVATEFYDGSGQHHTVSAATLERMLAALPPAGRYPLEPESVGRTESVPLPVTPDIAFQGSFDRIWVMAVQLYSLRSKRNWGIGDFTDLSDLIVLAARWGCAGIGLNPLHALFEDRPGECSPYAPNSRLFLNPLYVDPQQLPELPSNWLDERQDQPNRARAGDLIDYAEVAALKLAALRHAYANFKTGATAERRAAFQAFRDEQGKCLNRFACFEALRRQFGGAWWEWPALWRRPDDERLQELRRGAEADEISFVEFAQWCAATQLQACAELAATSGMKLGLYLDIAVGVQAGGFDAWNEQDAIARELSVGAPPDVLNTAGQDWGLAGFNAQGLEARNFEPFRQMLKASMRFAGAVRLDHVLGLNRLYLVPSGNSPRDGTYVDMPLAALLAVTARASTGENCVVIGEDLGTVPEGFRDRLAQWGVWSYKVMMFERAYDGAFSAADTYPANSLVTFNTHDLASFAGWRSHHDLRVKRGLGLDPGETDDQRAHANAAFERRLADDGIETKGFDGAVTFLARTPARILAIALDDLLGIEDQPNIPGTVQQHPNWRRRLPVGVEEIADRIDVAALHRALQGRA